MLVLTHIHALFIAGIHSIWGHHISSILGKTSASIYISYNIQIQCENEIGHIFACFQKSF